MLEVEVKARIADANSMRRTLKENGFCDVSIISQRDEYFTGVGRDFKKTDEALRIRTNKRGAVDNYAITYKGPRLDDISKTRVEHEIKISDPAAMRELLNALGHRSVYIVDKKRECYKKGEIEASLDFIQGLGYFLELETNKGNAKHLIEMTKKLGISKSDLIRKSYLELMIENGLMGVRG